MAALAIDNPKETPNNPNTVSLKGLNDTFCPQCVNPLAKDLRKLFKDSNIACENVSDAVFAFLATKFRKKPSSSEKPTLLGEGMFGKVYKVGDYAIKRITRFGDSIQLLIELSMLAKLESPYIVKFEGFFIDSERNINIIMEYMSGGDLFNFFESSFGNKPSLETVLNILCNVAKGIHFLHTQSPPIVNRDLKLENILLDAHGNAKLSDFGTITFYLDKDHRITTGVNKVGSKEYLPPRDAEVSPAIDMYAFGIVCVMMLATLLLTTEGFNSDSFIDMYNTNQTLNMFDMVKESLDENKENEVVDAELLSLIKSCLDVEARNRPSAEAMVNRLSELVTRKRKSLDSVSTSALEELVEAQQETVKKLKS